MSIDLQHANRIIRAGIRISREMKLKPMTLCMLDSAGHIVSVLIA